ncbi:cytochrome P450 [Roridomyces roridus]|uniref:Cytochrome P450 n=1 Tax=Roridomyces roridus TaxID=1738132 RepID=A0AAD7BHD8_9AGAR|nr:cytochrome P450 [Roridomyces roridus]
MNSLQALSDRWGTNNLAAAGALATALYAWRLYSIRQANKDLPPHVPYTNPILGSTLDYMHAPHEWLAKNFDKYGPVMRASLFGREQYLIDTPLIPDAMKHKNFNSEQGANAIQFLDVLVGLAVDYHMEDGQHLVLKALNNRMEIFVERIRPYISLMLDEKVGRKSGPVTVEDPFKLIRSMIAQAMCDNFVGKSLGRDPEMIHVFTHVTDVVAALATAGASSMVALIVPGFRRWYANYMVNNRKILKPYTDILIRKLTPEIEARVALRQSCGTNELEWEGSKPVDVLQTILDDRNIDLTNREAALARIGEVNNLLLFLIFASVHLTSVHITWMINSIALHTECHEELLKELKLVLASHGGVLSDEALRNMPKLDSFMRETFRTRFDCIGGSQRIVQEDTLLEGKYLLPKGALLNPITFRAHQNPGHWPGREDVMEFQPWSHEEPSSRTSPAYLQFGLGRHACPGRFLAVNEAKLIVSYLLGRYDVKLKEPEKGVVTPMPAFTFSIAPTSAIVLTPRDEKDALVLL